MSTLAPLSGFAIKTMWSHLRREAARKAFTFWLNTLTLAFIFLWVGFYSASYHGTDSAVTTGLFDEQSWWDEIRPTAFTVVTLLTEISVTSVLAHRLDKIAAFYAPNYWLENPEFLDLLARLEAMQQRQRDLLAALEQAEGDLAAYQASLEAQTNLAILAYDARRGERNGPIL